MVTIPGLGALEPIGRGGFSTVYRAQQISPSRTVAVKVLHLDLSEPGAAKRFQRECDATALLTGHANVITVLESGTTSDGTPYMVLPYCPGGSLQDRLRTSGPLPWEEVVEIGRKLTAALADVHRAGILHRDIKPHNVLLTTFGEPALADFGIATVLDSGLRTSTTASLTPLFSAPEILRGGRATEAADVYSLGATLYALLTGRPPFTITEEEGMFQAFDRIIHESPAPLGPATAPRGLADLISAMLAKAPGQRPSLGQVAADFAALANGDFGATTITRPPVAPIADHRLHTVPNADGGLGVGRSSHGWGAALAGLAAVSIVAVGALVWSLGDDDEPRASDTTIAVADIDPATLDIELQHPELCGDAAPQLATDTTGDLDGDGAEELVVALRCGADGAASHEVQVFSGGVDGPVPLGAVGTLTEPADRFESLEIVDGRLHIDAMRDPSSTPTGDYIRPIRMEVAWNGAYFEQQTIDRVELVRNVLVFDEAGFGTVEFGIVGFDRPVAEVADALTEVFDVEPVQGAGCAGTESYAWLDEGGRGLTIEGTAESVTVVDINAPIVAGTVLRTGSTADRVETGAGVGSTAEEFRSAFGGGVDGPVLDASSNLTVMVVGDGRMRATTNPGGGDNPGIDGIFLILPGSECGLGQSG